MNVGSSRADHWIGRLGLAVLAARWNRYIIARRYLEPGRALIGAKAFDEADALFERGLAAFPRDPDLLFTYATVPQHRRTPAVAIDRWQAALAAVPERSMAYIALSAIFLNTRQSDRAADIINQARQRFPDDLFVLAEYARVAEHRGALEDAAHIWRKLCAEPNPPVSWPQRYALLLVRLKDYDAAEQVVDTAVARYHTEAEMTAAKLLIAVRGQIAAAREDWPAAVAFWTDYRVRFPNATGAWQHGLGNAKYQIALGQAAQPAPAGPAPRPPQHLAPAAIDVVIDAAKKTLLLGFESLGSTCEMGLVQRHFGAEPLGLFRWNTVMIEPLIAALDHAFAGMGEAANTELAIRDNGEFFVCDRRWGFDMHTWILAGKTDPDALHAQMCRRIVFLKEKLLADLAAADKMFVYVSGGLDAHDMQRLHVALKAHGPIKLLVVQPRETGGIGDCEAGSVIRLADDLCLGVLSRRNHNEGGEWDIAFDDWIAVCETAAEIWGGGGILSSEA